jgi:hypothetical protein
MRDILHARQIRQRDKRAELAASKPPAELPPPRASVADFIGGRASGELLRGARAARRTTGEL